MQTDTIKKMLEQLKEKVSALDKRTKIIAPLAAAALVLIAVLAAVWLNQAEYAVLYSELADEEAAEIVGKLQENGADYRYKGGGTILVEKTQVDKVRADLAYEGYPRNGFAYDIYIDNAGGMVTDAEKKTYQLYQLQDRIGATIALFDGVRDAKVNIALGKEDRYVLGSGKEEAQSKASVVVTMKSGAELQAKQAAAIQRLVAKSVINMPMENVSVFDQNGVELTEGTGESASGTSEAELQELVERRIEQKVINVLVPFFGDGNLRVSVTGKLNMDKILRETTTYSTPEKVDEQDKTGILSEEQGSLETGAAAGGASGVAGTEPNADVSEYPNGGEDAEGSYRSESYDRNYLVNQVKEQTEINPGVMDDLSVAVSVNAAGLEGLGLNEVRELVANAAGISVEEAAQKITIVTAPFYTASEKPSVSPLGFLEFVGRNWVIFAVGGAVFLLLLLLIFLLGRRRRKKKRLQMAEEQGELLDELLRQQKPGKTESIDILTIQNDRSKELRDRIREFANTNPEISAQMLRNLLNGGEGNE